MDASRSTRLIAVGAAALVVGTALTALAVRGAEDAAAAPAPPPPAAAVETTPPVAPAPRIPETITVPDGHEAVAIQLPFDAGVAGLPAVGDRVNVYAIRDPDPAAPGDHEVTRVLTAVEVLAITGPEITAGGGTPTTILAVDGADVDDLVLDHTAARLWLTLTPEGEVAR